MLAAAAGTQYPALVARPVEATARAATVRRNGEATTEMANIPQKSSDPTEEALSAIQEALSTGQPARPGEAAAAPAPDNDPVQAPPPAADLFREEPQPTTWESRRGAAAPSRQ